MTVKVSQHRISGVGFKQCHALQWVEIELPSVHILVLLLGKPSFLESLPSEVPRLYARLKFWMLLSGRDLSLADRNCNPSPQYIYLERKGVQLSFAGFI